MRRIACLDLDAFFVEVALKDVPHLRGHPLAVGGDPEGRGVVCSASYEARRFGIKAGMPLWMALNRCRELRVLPVPPTIGEFSDRVRRRLQAICPVVDSASVDEFYLDFTGCDRLYRTNLAIADRMCHELAQDPALPATVGFGTSRLIAKIASDLAKPRGVLEVFPGAERQFLASLPLKQMPGVGPQTEEKLRGLGLSRIGDIVEVPFETWSRMLGRSGEALFAHAEGQCCTPVIADDCKRHQKQISRERTLYESTESAEVLLSLLSRLTEDAAYDLRQQQLTAGGLSIKIRYDDFVTQTRSRKITRTNRELDLFHLARDLFQRLYSRRVKVRLLGVRLEDLQSGGCTGTLDQLSESADRRRLPHVVDEIRERFGFRSILRASSVKKPVPRSASDGKKLEGNEKQDDGT